MISLSVVKIKVGDEKYLLTRHELNQVRALMMSIKSDDPQETKTRLATIMKGKHTFESGKEYSLALDSVKIDATFYVWNTHRPLNGLETAHIIKLINCAISAPNTLLAFPDYIVISDVPPTLPVKPKAKRKKKATDK
jgi:hypothetical protein